MVVPAIVISVMMVVVAVPALREVVIGPVPVRVQSNAENAGNHAGDETEEWPEDGGNLSEEGVGDQNRVGSGLQR